MVLDTECDKGLQSIYNIMREVKLHHIWKDFLPVGMIDFQAQYYHQIGSKKSAKHWGSDLIKKC